MHGNNVFDNRVNDTGCLGSRDAIDHVTIRLKVGGPL